MLFSRSSTEEEKNLKNSRRKREANGHIKDETTTKDGETTTKDGGAESSSTEKEVKKKRKKKKIEHLQNIEAVIICQYIVFYFTIEKRKEPRIFELKWLAWLKVSPIPLLKASL